MATAIKRGKTWTAYWEVGRDPATRKRQQTTKGGFRVKVGKDGETGALDYAHEQERAVRDGAYVPPVKLTVQSFLERWLADYASHKTRPRTVEGYEGVIKRYVVPILGSIELQRLTPAAIQRLYGKLLTQGLSGRTVLHVHRVLKESLAWAVRWQLLVRNPGDAVSAPKPKHYEPVVLTPEAANKLLTAAKGMEIETPIMLALSTGLRRGELVGLHWADVNLDAGYLIVTQSVQVVVGKGIVTFAPKTARSRRRIALSRETVSALRVHKARQAAERLRLGPLWHDEGWVFTGPDGRVMRPDGLTQRFALIVRSIGWEGLRFHDLRHAHASFLLLQGQHPKVVSERLGHATIAITMDTYSHLLPRSARSRR